MGRSLVSPALWDFCDLEETYSSSAIHKLAYNSSISWDPNSSPGRWDAKGELRLSGIPGMPAHVLQAPLSWGSLCCTGWDRRPNPHTHRSSTSLTRCWWESLRAWAEIHTALASPNSSLGEVILFQGAFHHPSKLSQLSNSVSDFSVIFFFFYLLGHIFSILISSSLASSKLPYLYSFLHNSFELPRGVTN
jgi:hypothetical protein